MQSEQEKEEKREGRRKEGRAEEEERVPATFLCRIIFLPPAVSVALSRIPG